MCTCPIRTSSCRFKFEMRRIERTPKRFVELNLVRPYAIQSGIIPKAGSERGEICTVVLQKRSNVAADVQRYLFVYCFMQAEKLQFANVTS